jgi:benzoate transport
MASVTTGVSASEAPAGDVRRTIGQGSMSRLQIGAVAICVALNMLDGFDVLVIAFTSVDISRDWQLTGREFGLLVSAGLFGMAGGSLFLAPWADRIGRRAVILVCLVLITLGMLCSALAQGPLQLGILRVITGLGIGGMLASIGVITAEYSSDKWRSTNIALQATGYPVGATIGGVIAAVLIARYGWRSAFLFGGIASAVMIPVVLRSLPESLDFLLARRPTGALEKVNNLLRRMGRGELQQLPAPSAYEPEARGNPVRGLFSPGTTRSTLLIWSSFFLLMFSFYFIMGWTPRLLVRAGWSEQEGIAGSVLLNLGGIFGGTLFAWLAARAGLRKLTALFLALTAVFTVAFGFVATQFVASLLAVVAVVIGVFLIGSMAGLYSLAPALYPAAVRTTGLGWGIGIGRIGAIIAPYTAGILFDDGWSAMWLYCIFAMPLLGALLTTRALRVR